MGSLDQFAKAKLASLEAGDLRRELKGDRRLEAPWVERGGRRLVSFSCNDYLGLSHHPAVIEAAAQAAREYGAGAGASRLVTGDHPLLGALEARIAAWKGTQAACVFGSGYLANLGITPVFAKPGDLVIVDELSHACLWAGAKLSGATVVALRHNDMGHLDNVLAAARASHAHALVLTDGVFSMDGDLAPLDEVGAICAKHDAWAMVDDAHGLGVVGGGRGSVAVFPGADIALQMGTLSKAAGSYGGYLAASRDVVDLVKNRARSFVYSTGLPPPSAAAALAAFDVMEAEPERVAAPLDNARLFTRLAGLPEAKSAIVPVVLGAPGRALAAAARLEAQGFLVAPIRPPTVPEGTARLRLAFNAGHTPEQVERLAAAARALMTESFAPA